MQISGGGSISMGGASAGGWASFDTSGLTSLGNAAINMVNEGVAKAGDNLSSAADKFAGKAGDAVHDVANKGAAAFDKTAEFVSRAGSLIPHFHLPDLRGRIQLPHTPPRPDFHIHGRLEVNAEVKGMFHVHNGGWAATGGVRIGDVRADGSFSVEHGKIPTHLLADMKDTIKNVLSAGAGGIARLGFDLAAKCAANPLLSAVLSKIPAGLQMLTNARAAVTGGFTHMMNFFKSLVPNFNVNVSANVNINAPQGGLVPAGPNLTTMPVPGQAPAKPGGYNMDDPGSILRDPNLSFEDKIFLFCLAYAGKQEKKITDMMKRFTDAQGAAEGKAPTGSPLPTGPGAFPAPPGGGPSMAKVGGLLGKVGEFLNSKSSAVGGIVGLAKNLGVQALGIASNVVPVVLPAIIQGASGLLSAIPVVGSIAAAGVGAIGGPLAGMISKGGLTAAAGVLKALPLETVASTAASVGGQAMAGVGNNMAANASAAPSSHGPAVIGGSAPAAPAKAPGGGILATIKSSLPGGLLGLLALVPDPHIQMIGIIGAGIALYKGKQKAAAAAGNQAGGSAAPAGGPGAPAGGATANPATKFQDNDGITYTAGDKESENQFMQKLSNEQQKLTKTYDMCSNLMKAMHDSQMTAIRNMH